MKNSTRFVKLYLIHSSLADLILGPRSTPFMFVY